MQKPDFSQWLEEAVNDRSISVSNLATEYEIYKSAHSNSFVAFFASLQNQSNFQDLVAHKDSLLAPDEKLNTGEYYTAKSIVDRAHQYILNYVPEAYMYSWYDCCAGTGNLTRSNPNKNSVWLSTLDYEDTEILKLQYSNVFQADFLNDDLPNIFDKNKSWVFILNPPYAAPMSLTEGRNRFDNKHKDVNTETKMMAQMREESLARAARNLTSQFLYRIGKIIEENHLHAYVAIFSQTAFLNNGGYKPFTEWWLNRFTFCNGFCFHCSEFHGTKGSWPVLFSLWKVGPHTGKIVADVWEKNKLTSTKCFGQPEKPLGDYITRPKGKTPAIPMKSAMNPLPSGEKAFSPDGSLGFVKWMGNDVLHNKNACILSGTSDKGWNITKDNFEDSLWIAGARCMVDMAWLNDRDQYSVPDFTLPGWNEFKLDLIIWMLFSVHNQSSSLSNLEYNDSLWTIKNEMFSLDYRETFNNIDQDSQDRHAFAWLKSVNLSSEAQKIFDFNQEIVDASFPYREYTDTKFQLHRWDAGLYQIRRGLLIKGAFVDQPKWMPDMLKEQQKIQSEFKKKLLPGIYDYRILIR